MKNYYDMLSVAPNAPADDIKKAFRREIARYHPDKVQHLGREFQDMASGIAADLTEAYRILMDPALRAKYDEELGGPQAPPPQPPPPRPAAQAPVAPPPFDPGPPPPPSPSRAGAGIDFIRRASMSKLREAIEDVMSSPAAVMAPGFDFSVVTKAKKGLFKKGEPGVCLLVKFVAMVDAESVAKFWPAAARVVATDADSCVLMLIGPAMAPARELAAAVTEQRRKGRTSGPVLVPVDVRDWDALFPPEAPAAVRALIQRLKDEKR